MIWLALLAGAVVVVVLLSLARWLDLKDQEPDED